MRLLDLIGLTVFFLCGFYFGGENGDAFEAVEGARGKALRVAKPAFPPRAPPFRARSCSRLWGCVELLTGQWMLRYRERKAGALDGCV